MTPALPIKATLTTLTTTTYPLLLVPVELYSSEGWAPAPKLVDPVVQRGFRHDHQVRPRDTAVFVQVGQ